MALTVICLFASLSARDGRDRTGTIYLEARTPASAVADMELADELADGPDEFEDDTSWAEAADPSESPYWARPGH